MNSKHKTKLFFTLLLLFMMGTTSSYAQNGGPSVELKLVAEGFTAPIQLAAPEDGTGRRFIVDQIGVILILTEDGMLLDEPFLDLRDKIVELKPKYDERGLLGLAFHPDFKDNGRFFVYYSAPLQPSMPDSFNHANRLVEYRVSDANLNRADTTSAQILMELPWPYANHNGGTLAFGPGKYLFVPLGDGGNRDDQGRGHVEDWYKANVGGNGQDIEQNLLGSILRIDVDSGNPYGVPPDNPFVEEPGMDEIWAYGFRNPFRIAFDAETGRLFASDAGQNLWEEVNIVGKGGNYGWNVMEGTHCFDAEHPQHPPYECPDRASNGDRLRLPIIQYDHYGGVVVVGGVLFRGQAVPVFQGKYLFADWSSNHSKPRGTLFIASPPPEDKEVMWSWQQLHVRLMGNSKFQEYVRSFGQDANLDTYVLTSDNQGPRGSTGKVFKIVGGSTKKGGHSH